MIICDPSSTATVSAPYDAQMALALCDTVWRDAVEDDDYEAIVLYSDDSTARYLASLRLSEEPWESVERMLFSYDGDAETITHFAEFICLYYPRLTDCEHMDDVVSMVYRQAKDCGAREAVRLLERYCIYPELCGNDFADADCPVSPYEADWLLRAVREYSAEPESYLGESELHWDIMGSEASSAVVRIIFAIYAKDGVLHTLQPYRDFPAEDTDAIEALAEKIDHKDWIRFLEANGEKSRIAFDLLCRYGNEAALIRLYERYRSSAESSHPFTHYEILRDLYSRLKLNGSDAAKRICGLLRVDIDAAEAKWTEYRAKDHPSDFTAPFFAEPFADDIPDDAERWRILNEQEEELMEEGESEADDDSDAAYWEQVFSESVADTEPREDEYIEDFDEFDDFDDYDDYDDIEEWGSSDNEVHIVDGNGKMNTDDE